MLAPTSSFDKLSLSQKMQTSRGHMRGQSGGKGKEPRPSDDPSSSEADESDSTSNEAAFGLDHCREISTLSGERRFAFQIAFAEVDHFGVRIDKGNAGTPSCTCEGTEPCQHVDWLLERLGRIRSNGSNPYERISDIGLNSVCFQLHWQLREGADSHSDERIWQLKKEYPTVIPGRQTRGMTRERGNEVRDILATLSPYVTDEYRADIFDFTDEITPDNVYVPGDLEATCSKLLLVDDEVLDRFKALVPRNDRASDYFHKMTMKAQNACHLLDEYIHNGPAVGQFDLAWCAQTLVHIVNSIDANIRDPARAPLSRASREEAAKALVSILNEVANRNNDAYASITWPRRRPHGERETDRNLYKRIVGSASRPGAGDENFVINVLDDLPDVGERFVEDLEGILAKIETIGWDTPRPYLNKLKALIIHIKRVIGGPALSSSGPSTSSGKRPAGSMDRKAKRTK